MSALPAAQVQPLEMFQVTRTGKDKIVRPETGEKFCRFGWFIWGIICIVLIVLSLIPLALTLLTGVIAVGSVAAGVAASNVKN